MIVRLLVGLVKGLVVGGLLGFALAKLGFVAPGAVIAFLAAAAAGALVGLVAGKPIWAKDAKIEAGMKAIVGALLGAGIMFAIRRWVTVPMPFSLGALSAPNTSLVEAGATHGTLGGLAVTSLALVAAVLGGFYEVDNTPEPEGGEKSKTGARVDDTAAKAKNKPRVASSTKDVDDLDDDDVDVDPKRAKR